MSSEKIESFWVDATADDVARVMAGETVEARFRDREWELWHDQRLAGWIEGKEHQWRSSAIGGRWNQCQVYREPSWWTNKPDPGPGWTLLGKFPDEKLKPGDEAWDLWDDKQWAESDNANGGGHQVSSVWYRRRIEPVEPKFAVGQTVQVVGPKAKSSWHWGKEMDRYIGLVGVIRNSPLEDESRRFYNLEGIGIWGFREDYLEPVEPEPKHYVLRVGDSANIPNGLVVTITEKGFEVTQ